MARGQGMDLQKQILKVIELANKEGLADAADWIKREFEARKESIDDWQELLEQQNHQLACNFLIMHCRSNF